MTVWRGLRQLASSFSLASMRDVLKGTNKRALQEQLDTHRLFLYTSLHAQHQLPGSLPEGFAEHVISKAAQLSFVEQKAIVQKHLTQQLLNQATIIHDELLQASDPVEVAQAYAASAQQQRQQQVFAPMDATSNHNHPASPSHRRDEEASSSTTTATPPWAIGNCGSNAGVSGKFSTGNGARSMQRKRIGQQELGERVGKRLGFRLEVRRSNIEHEEAGLGLFVAEGETVQPGTLIALFPGVVYARSSYRRMPNYPKVDRDNPYLIARYDGRIIDSRPWGRGAMAPPMDIADHPLLRDEGAAAAGSAHGQRRRGVVGRIVAASDGRVEPIPATEWVHATTGEAAQMEALLEGRHPLALAHFANHPGSGTVPNTMVASYNICMSDGDKSGKDPSMRAYLPVMPYMVKASHAHLLEEEVHGVGLVTLRALAGGEEVLFNYRLSPGLLGRPRWYVPVNEQEEDRRWS